MKAATAILAVLFFAVLATAANEPPAIDSTPTTTGTAGVGYNYQANAVLRSTAAGATINWSLTTMPAGATVSAAGLVNFTPPASGTYVFTIQAKDPTTGSATQSWKVIVP